jgi:hypothetical protein
MKHLGVMALFVLVAPLVARGDDTHYQDFVVGGRAVGLAGAFTSLADDPSGIYYNPAGLADAHNTNLQVSTSLYGFERGSIEDRLTLPVPGVENLDIQFTDLIIIPASAGFVKTFGPLDEHGYPYQAYGISVLVPSYRSLSAQSGDEFKSYQRRTTDRELWTGTGYGRRVSQRLRLGVSAYYILRSVSDRESVTVREPIAGGGEKFQTVNNDISLLTGSALLMVGAKYAVTEHLALGASIQSPSWQLHSSGTLRFESAVSDPSAAGGPESYLETPPAADLNSKTERAPMVRFGASYSRKYKYTFSGDLSYHAPVSYTLAEVDPAYEDRLPFNPKIERQAVLNFNIGAEYLVVREVSIAGGFFSDYSSSPAIRENPPTDQPADVDLYGLVMAIGYFGEHTLSRLGVSYSFGTGYDVIPQGSDVDRLLQGDQSFRRVGYFQSFFYVFLSSTFRY